MIGNIKERLGQFVDIALVAIFVIGSIYAYDQYKQMNQKIYVIDASKVFQLKQKTLSPSTATEDDVMKYYESFEKMVRFSDNYINAISEREHSVVYSKNYVLTTKSDKVIDLTDELIIELKKQKLLP